MQTKDQIIQNAIDHLISMFKKSGDMPERVAFSIIQRREGESDIPSQRWSLSNQIIMWANGTADARGYRQWQQVNRYVKKGSSPIYILAPLLKKKTELNPVTGKEEERFILIGFRAVPVFRYEDTDGMELPEREHYEPKELPPFWDVAEKLGIKTSFAPLYRNALGTFRPGSNSIQLYATDAQVYFHELAHAIHNSFKPLYKLDKAVCEVVAEFSSLVLCELQGIKGYERQGLEYLADYAKTTADKPDAVIRKLNSVMNDVEKIVTIVLDTTEEKIPVKEEAPAVA